MKKVLPMKHMLLILCCVALAYSTNAQCDFTLSITPSPVSCFGGNDGSIDLTVTNGTGPFTFNWASGNVTEDLPNLQAGIYTVTVTDALACTATISTTISQPPEFTVDAPGVLLDCITTTAVINVNVTGAAAPYSWALSNGVSGNALSAPFLLTGVTAPGAYSLTVTNANGCTASDLIVVNQDIAAPLASAGQDETLTCSIPFAQLNGTASSTGGNFIVNWASFNGGSIISGQNSPTPLVDAPGTYILTITNTQNGCTATDMVNVNQDFALPVAEAGQAAVLTCVLTSISLNGAGSSTGAPITYTWTTTNGNFTSGTNTLNPIVNAPGTYTLLVTNLQNGCTASDVVVVVQDVSFPAFSSTFQFGIPCGGGSVTLPAPGNPPNLTYAWTGPGNFNSNVQNPVVSAPGIYTVIVTNSTNGCTSSGMFTVFPGPVIPQQNFVVSKVSCIPGQLGAIDLTVDFGTGPYTYLWSTNSTTEDINNLGVGTYTVTVNDALGCAYHASVWVAQASATVVLNFVTTPVTCFGTNTGGINLTASGGVAPYTFSWSGPQGLSATVEDLSNVPPGNYTLTVTEANGCTKTAIINIPSPQAISLPLNGIVITNPGCLGFSSGAIHIAPQGGMPPYSYDWSNDGPQSLDNNPQNLQGIPAGIYTVTITDAIGCTFVSSAFSLSLPSILQISAVPTHVTCGGSGNDGGVSLTVTGGAPPFTYLWSNGATVPGINNLPAGSYTVTVTQSNGCTGTSSTTILIGGTIIPQGDFSVTAASCPSNSADGAITLNTFPAGAQAPLTFLWQGPAGFTANTQNISGLTAGDYALTLTDATSCQFVATVTVDQLPGDFILAVNPGTTDCFNGIIELTVSGGVPPFQYLWSNGSTTQHLVYNTVGTYTVTVIDALGCSKTINTIITDPVGLVLTTTVVAGTCNGVNDGAINLTVANGTSNYTYAWSNTATTQNLSGLTPGTYCVTVTDIGSGCSEVACAVLSAPPILAIMPNAGTAPTCTNSFDGFISINLINPGTGPYTWSMSGSGSLSGSSATSVFPITGLTQGTYCVTVTNDDGCTASTCATIVSPPPVVATIEELSNTCNSAVIRANVTGGVAPLTYSWESGLMTITATTQTIVAPLSTIYQVLVLDANGCGDFANIIIELANGGNCGYIRGTVAIDANENCLYAANETGLAGWLVRAEGADTLYGVTDANGKYLVSVPNGSYKMAVLPPNNLWNICPNVVQANVNQPNDTVFGGNFPLKAFETCPALSVSIGISQLRRCFSNNYYFVTYCNEGTAVANNAYVDVTLDPFLAFENSSAASQSLGNNVYRFYLGQVDIGDCGSFYVRVSVNCSAALGQTHCTEAHIFPDTLCNTNALWSGASLDVRSVCAADSVRFVIKNVGTASMTSIADYIVVEDAVMFMQAQLPLLNAGDSITIAYPANGSTWRVEVAQEIYHPYPQPASLSVEGCTTNSSFSTGFVNQFALNDSPPTLDIDCTVNTGSYDPNDKHGYPIGYGAAHYVRPGTEIAYKIRFQNTGTDTAFTVRVIDTLSTWLDPTTVKFGASSHPYRYDLCGEGIVHFIFENIMLPDSNVNEAASNGFATFTVTPRADVPLESLVENSAAIYFDYNDPVITNTTFHRLGKNFLSLGLWQPHFPNAQVLATPNPFAEETVLEVRGLVRPEALQLQVFDYQGNELRKMTSDGAVFHLKKGDWSAGVYFFKITQNGKLVGSGKLVAQ
jgi:uncharacterized repeat protein (TIGR01451 family)